MTTPDDDQFGIAPAPGEDNDQYAKNYSITPYDRPALRARAIASNNARMQADRDAAAPGEAQLADQIAATQLARRIRRRATGN